MTIRWMGPVVTDLSVELHKQSPEEIREIVMATKDDEWAKKLVDDIVETCATIEHGMRRDVSIREVAVHIANRRKYFAARANQPNPHVHMLLDELLIQGLSMEGVIPATVVHQAKAYSLLDKKWYQLEGMVTREHLGKYNFQAYTVQPEFKERWAQLGYPLIEDNVYKM